MTVELRVALLCDAHVDTAKLDRDLWAPGPYKLQYVDHKGKDVVTDRLARSTNFPGVVAPYLFGTDPVSPSSDRSSTSIFEDEVRFHRRAAEPYSLSATSIADGVGVEEMYIDRIELLAASQGLSGRPEVREIERPAVLALQLRVRVREVDVAIDLIERLCRERAESGNSYVRGFQTHNIVYSLGELSNGIVFPSKLEEGAEGSVYSVVLDDTTNRSRGVEVSEVTQSIPDEDRMFRIAAAQPLARFHSSDVSVSRAKDEIRHLSRSWSMLFLRHGAVFQLHSPLDDRFRRFADIFFSTLYIDAVMLARLQAQLVRRWELEVGRLLESTLDSPDLGALNSELVLLLRDMAIDQSRYLIRRSVSHTGSAVSVLHVCQDVLELQERIDGLEEHVSRLAVLADRDDSARRSAAQERLSLLVTVIASVAIPVTFFVDMFQLLSIKVTSASVSVLLIISCLVSVALGSLLYKLSSRNFR